MRLLVIAAAALIMCSCTSLRIIDSSGDGDDWVSVTKRHYAEHGSLTIQVRSGPRYSIDEHPMTLHELCFIDEKCMLPRDTKVYIEAGKNVTHEEFHPAHIALHGQYWKIAFTKTDEDAQPEAGPYGSPAAGSPSGQP